MYNVRGIFYTALVEISRDRKKYIFLTLFLVCVNFFFDRLTKILAETYLKGSGSLRFLNDTIILTYTENRGSFLSLGADWNIYIKYCVLLVIPVVTCIFALLYLVRRETKLYRIITGSCIIGGGFGNLADRFFGNFTVVDFLNFGIGNIRTGILNSADMSVTFGIIAFFIFETRAKKRGKLGGL
ncbi:MAG: signal peptidase II [Spirochaetales bacterium]|jgi:signal peptidase II|nr:signal peptidase II [Spirochaetales bacterium]